MRTVLIVLGLAACGPAPVARTAALRVTVTAVCPAEPARPVAPAPAAAPVRR